MSMPSESIKRLLQHFETLVQGEDAVQITSVGKLALVTIKNFVEFKNFFQELFLPAIRNNHLNIVEALLEADDAGAFLYKLSGPAEKWRTNGLQIAADLGHLAIAYCLADKIISTGRQPDSYFQKWNIQRLPDLENYIHNIQGQSISIIDFLRNYEQQGLSKISSFNTAHEDLCTKLPPALAKLIMDYIENIESYPSEIRSMAMPAPITFSTQRSVKKPSPVLELIDAMEESVTGYKGVKNG